jgi:hypothetical protein
MQREGSDNPRFKSTLSPLPPGKYRLKAEAELPDRTITSKALDLSVSEVSVEFRRVAQDRGNLQRLAGQSGGRYVDPEKIDEMAAHIPLKDKIVASTAEISFRMSGWVFTAILLLLGLEWTIRKRYGMI